MELCAGVICRVVFGTLVGICASDVIHGNVSWNFGFVFQNEYVICKLNMLQ